MRQFAAADQFAVPAIVVDATHDANPTWNTVYPSSVPGVAQRDIVQAFSRAFGHRQGVTRVAHVHLPHAPGVAWRMYVADDAAEDPNCRFSSCPGVNDGLPLPCPLLIVYPADKAAAGVDAAECAAGLLAHLAGSVRNWARHEVLVAHPELLGTTHVCTDGEHTHVVTELPHA